MYTVAVAAYIPGACIILGGFLVLLTQFIVEKVQDYHSKKYIDACELARYRAGFSKFDAAD